MSKINITMSGVSELWMLRVSRDVPRGAMLCAIVCHTSMEWAIVCHTSMGCVPVLNHPWSLRCHSAHIQLKSHKFSKM